MLHVKNSISAGSPLVLKNLVLAEPTDKKGNVLKLSVSAGANRVVFDQVYFSDARIGKMTGNGTGKTSAVTFRASGEQDGAAYAARINGDLSGVGTLTLSGQMLTVTGKTDIGNLTVTGSTVSTLRTDVTVKRNKSGQMTSVTSVLSVSGSIRTEINGTLRIALYDKATGAALSSDALTTDDPAFTAAKPAFQILKAPRADSGLFITYEISTGDTDEFEIIRKNGSFWLVNRTWHHTSSSYELSAEHADGSVHTLGRFVTFADAVWEIANRKDKTTAYTILVTNPAGETHPVEKYAMPKAGTLKSLTVRSAVTDASDRPVDQMLYYPSGLTISFTAPVTFENIRFVAENHTKPLNLSLGANRVTFKNSGADMGYGNITGNGIAKGSVLFFEHTGTEAEDVVITGKLDNVQTLMLRNTSVQVRGKTNIGILRKDEDSSFAGSATLTWDKAKQNVTAVTTNVTIATSVDTVTWDAEGDPVTADGSIELSLIRKDGTAWVPVLQIADGEGGIETSRITALEKNTFRLVNTKNLPDGSIRYRGASTDLRITRIKNVFVLTNIP